MICNFITRLYHRFLHFWFAYPRWPTSITMACTTRHASWSTYANNAIWISSLRILMIWKNNSNACNNKLLLLMYPIVRAFLGISLEKSGDSVLLYDLNIFMQNYNFAIIMSIYCIVFCYSVIPVDLTDITLGSQNPERKSVNEPYLF